METYMNSVDDVLIDGLTYNLEPGASYVRQRRSVTYYPQGSNVYSPTAGVKLVKIVIAGDEYLDPSTFRIFFDLVNNDTPATKRVRALSGPHIFFRRMRILSGGTLLEDIDNYGRVHEMFSKYVDRDYASDQDIMSFDSRWDYIYDPVNNELVLEPNLQEGFKDRKTGSFKPLSGLLNQFKYIPIRFAPITIELELVSATTDAVISPDGTTFTAADTSTNWEIQNVMVKVDVVTLDSALDNSISQHIKDNGTLNLTYSTFIFQEQQITDINFNVNVNRAVTQLRSVFINFVKTMPNVASKNWVYKNTNLFYHPMLLSNGDAGDTSNGEYNSQKEIELQLQLGSKLLPEYPTRSSAEAFYNLKKGLGIVASPLHGFYMDPRMYRSTHFSVCFDLEKVLDANFSGINTRSGELLTIRCKPSGNGIKSTAGGNNIPEKVHIILYAQYAMQVSLTGVDVLD